MIKWMILLTQSGKPLHEQSNCKGLAKYFKYSLLIPHMTSLIDYTDYFQSNYTLLRNLVMLEEERGKSTFNLEELSRVIYEGTENLAAFLKAQKIIEEDEVLRFDPKFIQTSRKVNMLAHAKKLIHHHKHYDFDYDMKNREGLFFSEQLPLSLHFYMFLITLANLCTDKQIEMFYKPALKGQILGCYSQTELGHGSDVQSLMTTATYDDEDQTFIINTPSTPATKWWIGDLGAYANHAIVFAQLIIKSKKYGVHAFLVPIRDKDHNPFPGVEVGEIGPKYGYNCKDNGFAIFTRYKIPRRNMLMKYTKVSKTGEYERRGNEKISYATMLMIRSGIPFGCHFGLSKACVIAVRYSLYRTQFKDEEGKQIPILDFQTQQEKVLTRVSECFAQLFGSQAIVEISRKVFNDAKVEKFDRLNEAHSLTSGLKAIFTTDTLNGVEILRRSMGGHGFSMYSGLPGIISELSPTPTYEGENTILYLQVARFLIKSLGYIAKGKALPPTVEYLQQIYREEPFVADFQNLSEAFEPEKIRKIMMYHSCEALKKIAGKMQSLISDGQNAKQVWDTKVGLDLKESAIAHTYFWIFETFQTRIYILSKNEKVRQVLTRLLLLYGIDKILIRSAQYFSTGVITGNTVVILKQAKEQLLKEIRPQALNLVEAFQYSDNTLHSALGIAKADPYGTLLKWAKESNEVNRPQIQQQLMQVWSETRKQLRPKL